MRAAHNEYQINDKGAPDEEHRNVESDYTVGTRNRTDPRLQRSAPHGLRRLDPARIAQRRNLDVPFPLQCEQGYEVAERRKHRGVNSRIQYKFPVAVRRADYCGCLLSFCRRRRPWAATDRGSERAFPVRAKPYWSCRSESSP